MTYVSPGWCVLARMVLTVVSFHLPLRSFRRPLYKHHWYQLVVTKEGSELQVPWDMKSGLSNKSTSWRCRNTARPFIKSGHRIPQLWKIITAAIFCLNNPYVKRKVWRSSCNKGRCVCTYFIVHHSSLLNIFVLQSGRSWDMLLLPEPSALETVTVIVVAPRTRATTCFTPVHKIKCICWGTHGAD